MKKAPCNRMIINKLAYFVFSVTLPIAFARRGYHDHVHDHGHEHVRRRLQSVNTEEGNDGRDHQTLQKDTKDNNDGLDYRTLQNNYSWLEAIPAKCKIIHHIHIPKTGGTSILEAMKSIPGIAQNTTQERDNIYVSRGTNAISTMVPHLTEQLSKGNYPLLLSLEVGIHDLQRHGYPFFNDTCFFATVRDPNAWLSSAANHMATEPEFTDGILGHQGFLDLDNIQSEMTQFGNEASLPSPVCLYTIETVSDLLCKLNGTQGTVCDHLDHLNVNKIYILNNTQEMLDEVIEKGFDTDVDLWQKVKRNNGKLCYGII